uniref:HTH La-type RNA-binding domain-containing protein n=1 Tax=Leersia perrieri TaxID=77586 RepID=A0A0D9W1M7_9ORYZ
MEPAGGASSPDPDHSSPPPPSTPKRSPWKQPSSSSIPNGGDVRPPPPPVVIDATNWPALSEAAAAKTPKPTAATDSSSSPAASSAVSKHFSPSHHATRHSKPSPRRTTSDWDHSAPAGRGAQPRTHSSSNNNGGGGRRGGGGRGGRRGGFDAFYRAPPIAIAPYMRAAPPPPPPPMPPFMGPPPPPISPMRPFAGPVVFHEMPSPVSPVSPMYYVGPPPPPEALRGLPFPPTMVGPPPYPYYQPMPDPDPEPEPEPEPDENPQDHRAKLLKQIEFYFSKDNLCSDVYLRKNMDDQGWVDIALIAGFKKVKASTDDLQYIKDTIQSSSILEMEGDKIRRQNDLNKWVIPRESNPDVFSNSSAATSPKVNNLTAQLGGLGLQESAASTSGMVDENHHEVLPNGPTSTNNQAPVVEDSAGKL